MELRDLCYDAISGRAVVILLQNLGSSLLLRVSAKVLLVLKSHGFRLAAMGLSLCLQHLMQEEGRNRKEDEQWLEEEG